MIVFLLSLSMIKTIKFEVAGVVDKIDNMEEMGKPNRIDIYNDIRADKKVH